MLGPIAVAGCCINEMCGLDATLLGMGCRENGAAMMAGGGLPIMIPPAKRCDAPLMTPDAGMMPPDDDAGI